MRSLQAQDDLVIRIRTVNQGTPYNTKREPLTKLPLANEISIEDIAAVLRHQMPDDRMNRPAAESADLND